MDGKKVTDGSDGMENDMPDTRLPSLSAPAVFAGFCPIEPVAKGRPRFMRNGHAYTPKTTRGYEEAVRSWLMGTYGTNRMPMDGELFVSFEFVLTRPKSRPKTQRYVTSRPDLDNYIKAFLDACDFKQRDGGIPLGVLRDDARVVALSATKRYADDGEQVGTKFQIRHIEC